MGTRLPLPVAALLLAGSVAASAQTNDRYWSAGTALTLPKGRAENGLFQPYRVGRTDRLEWGTYLLLNLIAPNLQFKLSHGRYGPYSVASRIGFSYPTFLLRTLQRPGIGGFISPEADVGEIPPILATRAEILATRVMSDDLLFTARGGIGWALRGGPMDERTSIDLPLVYQRMLLYMHGVQLNLGWALAGRLSPGLSWRLDADLLVTPAAKISSAFFQKGSIIWDRGKRFRLRLGYILVYGEYPYGIQAHLLPTVGLEWAGKRS